MTDVFKWGAIHKGDLLDLADYERRTRNVVIPRGTQVLVWDRVSWWRNPLSKPPRVVAWPVAAPGNIARFCFAAGSEAERAYAVWRQPSSRVGF